MRFELSEKDKRFIEGVNKDLSEGENIPLFINEVGRRYYINFECLDVAKANLFALILLSSNPETEKNVEEVLGIRVNSLNYFDGDTRIGELKNYLREFLEKLEGMN